MKSTKEKIEIMQAFVEGKAIQQTFETKWVDTTCPNWDWLHSNYRIKPEQKYRPYESVTEMIADFDERFPSNRPKYSMPLIWVRGLITINTTADSMICGFDINTQEVWVGGARWVTMEGLFNKFTYLDGTPCGKLVE